MTVEKDKHKRAVKKEPTPPDPVVKRLDALIRLFIEMNKPKVKEEFNEATAARLLKSVDFSPTEIAKILGKKSRTDVAPYLYEKPKGPSKTRENKKRDKNLVKNTLTNLPNAIQNVPKIAEKTTAEESKI